MEGEREVCVVKVKKTHSTDGLLVPCRAEWKEEGSYVSDRELDRGHAQVGWGSGGSGP